MSFNGRTYREIQMNLFRFLGDLSHLASIILLIHKMRQSRSCSGISFKSQLLYAVVYCTRYLDLFFSFVSLYNSTMKLVFIGAQIYILYLMRVKFRPTNDMQIDTFRVEYILGGALVMSLLATYKYTFQEVMTLVQNLLMILITSGDLVIQHLVGICCNSTTTIDAATHWRGGECDNPLSLRSWSVSWLIYSQLDLEISK